MKSSMLSAVVATFAGRALADFDIYYESSIGAWDFGYSPHMIADKGITSFTSEPDCGDVHESNYIGIMGDVSSSEYDAARCDGCGDSLAEIDDWDIKELEIHVDGWGHATLYGGIGYRIRPSDDGPDLGKCERDRGGDEYSCTSVGSGSKAKRIFRCKSDKLGPW